MKAINNDHGEEGLLRDLLADLMHWCDAKGVDFEHELFWAADHHNQEK